MIAARAGSPCPIDACPDTVPPPAIYCREHWAMIPGDLKAIIATTWARHNEALATLREAVRANESRAPATRAMLSNRQQAERRARADLARVTRAHHEARAAAGAIVEQASSEGART